MSTSKIDPDGSRRDDAAYWAAALVLAIQNGNAANEETARHQLKRLGYSLARLADARSNVKGGAK